MSSTTPNATDEESLPVSAATNDLEAVGRELLQAKLDHVSEEIIRNSFREASVRISEGERLGHSEIQSMRTALERAEQAVELAARVSPEAAPRPDLWAYLDEQSKQEYIDDVKRRER